MQQEQTSGEAATALCDLDKLKLPAAVFLPALNTFYLSMRSNTFCNPPGQMTMFGVA